MWKEEKIINGVLSYRTTPAGKWTPYTLEQVSRKYADKAEALRCAKEFIDNVVENANEVRILI